MVYEAKTDWVDDPSQPAAGPGQTPIRAADLIRIEQGVADAHSAVGGAAAAEHNHDAGAITSGTFAVARIPSLAQSKITGLSDALDGKANTADIPAPQFTAEEVAALKALVAGEG